MDAPTTNEIDLRAAARSALDELRDLGLLEAAGVVLRRYEEATGFVPYWKVGEVAAMIGRPRGDARAVLKLLVSAFALEWSSSGYRRTGVFADAVRELRQQAGVKL